METLSKSLTELQKELFIQVTGGNVKLEIQPAWEKDNSGYYVSFLVVNRGSHDVPGVDIMGQDEIEKFTDFEEFIRNSDANKYNVSFRTNLLYPNTGAKFYKKFLPANFTYDKLNYKFFVHWKNGGYVVNIIVNIKDSRPSLGSRQYLDFYGKELHL